MFLLFTNTALSTGVNPPPHIVGWGITPPIGVQVDHDQVIEINNKKSDGLVNLI